MNPLTRLQFLFLLLLLSHPVSSSCSLRFGHADGPSQGDTRDDRLASFSSFARRVFRRLPEAGEKDDLLARPWSRGRKVRSFGLTDFGFENQHQRSSYVEGL